MCAISINIYCRRYLQKRYKVVVETDEELCKNEQKQNEESHIQIGTNLEELDKYRARGGTA